MTTYRQKIARYYNTKIKSKVFQPGDLVMRKAEILKPLDLGKLSPNWEGPYRISETNRPSAYRLETLEGSAILRT